jgi:SAM-dependent methyltransferase
MQRYIAESTVTELAARGVDLAASRVLELGAGLGGYSQVLFRKSNSFIASDLEKNSLLDAWDIPFRIVDVRQPFPFESCSFDLIYCSSLVEHIAEPRAMLRESRRVLRPGGTLFLSFPPFYSLAMVGGHMFKPFHFLGEKAAVWIFNRLHRTDIRDFASCYSTWGLYPLRIDRVTKLISDCEFEIKHVYTRMSAINTTQLPSLLKDLATWHVCYLAEKHRSDGAPVPSQRL